MTREVLPFPLMGYLPSLTGVLLERWRGGLLKLKTDKKARWDQVLWNRTETLGDTWHWTLRLSEKPPAPPHPQGPQGKSEAGGSCSWMSQSLALGTGEPAPLGSTWGIVGCPQPPAPGDWGRCFYYRAGQLQHLGDFCWVNGWIGVSVVRLHGPKLWGLS